MTAGWQFQVGKDVVCITDHWTKPMLRPCNAPEKDRLYRVCGIQALRCIGQGAFAIGRQPDEVMLRLAEYGDKDVWFSSLGFRPVRDTNIDVFLSALAPMTPSKEQVHDNGHVHKVHGTGSGNPTASNAGGAANRQTR